MSPQWIARQQCQNSLMVPVSQERTLVNLCNPQKRSGLDTVEINNFTINNAQWWTGKTFSALAAPDWKGPITVLQSQDGIFIHNNNAWEVFVHKLHRRRSGNALRCFNKSVAGLWNHFWVGKLPLDLVRASTAKQWHDLILHVTVVITFKKN